MVYLFVCFVLKHTEVHEHSFLCDSTWPKRKKGQFGSEKIFAFIHEIAQNKKIIYEKIQKL